MTPGRKLLCQHPSPVPHPKLRIVALGASLSRSLMSKFQRKKTESLSKSPKRQMPSLTSLPHATLQPVSRGIP